MYIIVHCIPQGEEPSLKIEKTTGLSCRDGELCKAFSPISKSFLLNICFH